jgi:hypothetical protein
MTLYDYYDTFSSEDLQSMLDNHQHDIRVSKIIVEILGGRNELLNA